MSPESMNEVDTTRKEARDEMASRRKGSIYVVQAGDSLSAIALKQYGDAARWPEILEANKDKISDPNLISVGMELRIP